MHLMGGVTLSKAKISNFSFGMLIRPGMPLACGSSALLSSKFI